MPDAADTQATFCATLVDEWARGGVRHAVVAPGSRSTPMALALAADERIAVHVFHDERVAGFVALGIGRATGHAGRRAHARAARRRRTSTPPSSRPTTPACRCSPSPPTARPSCATSARPQTIDQQHLYGRAVRWFVDPGVPDEAARGTWRALAARALAAASTGPVHLNLPFREPLLGTPGPLPDPQPRVLESQR